jgi:exopolysaccharide production protein ExoQ
MPPSIALLLGILFIVYLFVTGSREETRRSWALWIPLIWLMIAESRPIALWFNVGPVVQTEMDVIRGNPIDRTIFSVLIVFGLLIILRRGLQEFGKLGTTPWIVLFLSYCGISLFWSDFQFVALKRWTKEVGNVVMLLIILSDPKPMEAVRTVIKRLTYVLVPLSIVLIKYYLDYSRAYNPWTGDVEFVGVATSKNMLGSLCFVCGIFFLWELLNESNRKERIIDALVLGMIVWLLIKANSATSWICFFGGCFILLGVGFRSVRGNMASIDIFTFFIVMSFVILELVFDVGTVLVSGLGRDLTLTGRTELWADVLGMVSNPMIGAGYESFWLGDRLVKLWENYWWQPIQAHNGYLETYLNLGLIGLGLLMAIIFCCYRDVRRTLMVDFDRGRLHIAILAVALLNNLTEAGFKGGNIIWFLFLLTAMEASQISRLQILKAQDLQRARQVNAE